jgi:hypothetical protein
MSVKLTSLALVALLSVCSTALAQLAPQRTWPELKEAVQERANRNDYPMTGMKPDDVREILATIHSLDRDEWSAAWSHMGERYQVPIDDLYILLRSGTPKEAWVNPQGGHVGRGPGWPDGKILTDVAMPWLVQVLRAN